MSLKNLLAHETIQNVLDEDWVKAVKYVEKIKEEDFIKELVMDAAIEPFVINLQEDTSDSDSDSEGEDGHEDDNANDSNSDEEVLAKPIRVEIGEGLA